jgi:hypothetical protein
MATVVAPVETVDVSLVEQISKLEEALKVLKRTARQELKARRRRRGTKGANGQPAAKGETPEQLKAWHEEVRKVWDEMRKSDAKTPYKRAVAEASARRKGGAPVAAAPVANTVVEKKVSKKAAVAAPAPVEAEAPKKRAVKKASA